ncbi:MAG TPA: helix-turn-helix domain-containing protein [Actinomycetota bacterium]|nr:helix-turn-helix domain-containing protein [Actinomycetota bacterium]
MARPRAASKDAILEATLAIFRERGYEGTTIPAIAERLGVSQGTLYNYFPSKEKLLFACARAGGTPGAIFGELRAQVGVRPLEDLLEEAAEGVVRFFELRLPAMLMRGARPLPTDRPGVVFARRGLESVRAYFAAEVEAGRLDGDPDTLAMSFIGGLFYRAFFDRIYGLPRSFDDDDRRFARGWAATFAVHEKAAG